MLKFLSSNIQKTATFPISLWSILGIGIAQILIWGGSFFLLAVFARPIMDEMGWGREIVYGGLSIGLLVSAVVLPCLGRLFNYFEGKNILSFSGLLISLGLIVLAYSSNIWSFYIAWIVIGMGMALGLYDALFAVLGHYFGLNAKKLIIALTLISGFCTTIVWPVQVYAITLLGWRETLLFWAILLFIFIGPIYYYCLPKQEHISLKNIKKVKEGIITLEHNIYYLMSSIFMISSIIMTIMSIQLIDILQETGVTLVAAIAMSTLLGPSQIASRIFDLVTKFDHPIKSLLVSVSLVIIGIILLMLGPQYAVFGIIVYGAGNGLRSIIRGTLPLVLVNKHEYPLLMGKLAGPSMFAQAITPLIAGYIMEKYHANCLLLLTAMLAVFNVLLSTILMKKIKNYKVI